MPKTPTANTTTAAIPTTLTTNTTNNTTAAAISTTPTTNITATATPITPISNSTSSIISTTLTANTTNTSIPTTLPSKTTFTEMPITPVTNTAITAMVTTQTTTVETTQAIEIESTVNSTNSNATEQSVVDRTTESVYQNNQTQEATTQATAEIATNDTYYDNQTMATQDAPLDAGNSTSLPRSTVDYDNLTAKSWDNQAYANDTTINIDLSTVTDQHPATHFLNPTQNPGLATGQKDTTASFIVEQETTAPTSDEDLLATTQNYTDSIRSITQQVTPGATFNPTQKTTFQTESEEITVSKDPDVPWTVTNGVTSATIYAHHQDIADTSLAATDVTTGMKSTEDSNEQSPTQATGNNVIT